MKCKIILMLLCTGFFLMAENAIALGCSEQELHPNFSIEYMEGPVAADRSAHSFLRILQAPAGPESHTTPSGYRIIDGEESTFISKETGEYKTVEDVFTSLPLEKTRLEEIILSLNENCFWTLSEKYRDANVLDGWYERIRVVNGETEKQVVCVNKDNDRFDKVKTALFQIFEETQNTGN